MSRVGFAFITVNKELKFNFKKSLKSNSDHPKSGQLLEDLCRNTFTG
jgi:hypothetical protein